MLTLLELTTSDAVRAALGVDEEELTDETIRAAGIEDDLFLDLADWLPDGYEVSEIVEAGEAAARGTDAWAQYARLSAYAKAYCAHFFVASQDNWRLIRLTDGNVDERRRENTDPKILEQALSKAMAAHKGAFLELVDEVDATAGAFSLFGISSPTDDPVTG